MPRCKFCKFKSDDPRLMHWHLRWSHARNQRSASQFVRWWFFKPKAKSQKPKAESGKRKAESGKE
ncbi:hypothetical protein [Blastopirellula retiformator]|uniref:Uncharacterized protein n=1 Tax=Blastopirellula retiformator TaxID=2527970 RepID=A0A5C5VJB1_9BACT|nr:hypothetical protein [Blastopirellula retiformator]TWT38696.1 hypothetical protein Enr8_03900 [Blastopirellula retiformator]